MHAGNHYSVKEVITWTRRDIYKLLFLAAIPTVLYQVFNLKWMVLPWLPIALIGTAVAFVVGFKNNASYDRLWEARRIWGSIVNYSRSWAILARDYISNSHATNKTSAEELKAFHLTLYKRHFAWLTALRYQLREAKQWEAVYKVHNLEYKNKWLKVEEHESKMADALRPYLSEADYNIVMSKSNKAAQILALQSAHLQRLHQSGFIDDFRHMELEKMMVELFNQQGACERIKNFPYPRQYATLNLWYIKIFVVLLPFGMLNEFEKMGDNFVWLTIPFAALAGWIFTTMEKIGESSENPFEGSPNDVPITTISRNIEIDMMDILGVAHSLQPVKPQHNIML
jgi:ion channel-forming bestrophin family protein